MQGLQLTCRGLLGSLEIQSLPQQRPSPSVGISYLTPITFTLDNTGMAGDDDVDTRISLIDQQYPIPLHTGRSIHPSSCKTYCVLDTRLDVASYLLESDHLSSLPKKCEGENSNIHLKPGKNQLKTKLSTHAHGYTQTFVFGSDNSNTHNGFPPLLLHYSERPKPSHGYKTKKTQPRSHPHDPFLLPPDTDTVVAYQFLLEHARRECGVGNTSINF